VPEGLENELNPEERTLIAVMDLLGRKSKPMKGELRLFVYSDGSVEKRIGIE
jgi:hypothetical protein